MVEATGGGGTGTKVTTPGDEATGPTIVAKISNLTIENRGDGLKGGGRVEGVECTFVRDIVLATVTLTVKTVAEVR